MWLTHIHVRYDLQTLVGRNCIASYTVLFSWFDTDCLRWTTDDTACDDGDYDLDMVPGGWIIPAQQVTPGSPELLAESKTTRDM